MALTLVFAGCCTAVVADCEHEDDLIGYMCAAKPQTVTTDVAVHMVAVAAGAEHSVSLAHDGTVYTWGDCDHGQLGHGHSSAVLQRGDDWTDAAGPPPATVPPQQLTAGFPSNPGGRVALVAACQQHTACLTATGEVYSWGRGDFGRLGHGDETTQWQPRRIDSLADTRCIGLECGMFTVTPTTCFLPVCASTSLWTAGSFFCSSSSPITLVCVDGGHHSRRRALDRRLPPHPCQRADGRSGHAWLARGPLT